MESIEKLLDIMVRLRDPDTGCPWDREQDFSTLAPYTVEEAYEVVDAIRRNDVEGIRDELGDLLLQVVFHSRVAEEAGAFTFDDVAEGIAGKMLRRHPHVFGTDEERDRGAVAGSWERIKADERAASEPADNSVLHGIAGALPSLKRAEKLGKRAAGVGFDWPDRRGPMAKIAEELAELQDAMTEDSGDREREELGDLLFAVANLARHLKIDPEEALALANRKFERRFREMEAALRQTGTDLASLDIETLEAHWQAAKSREKAAATGSG
jgi:tetrapyrrole methylase family protein/MazG family protein/ATP diphosphatase